MENASSRVNMNTQNDSNQYQNAKYSRWCGTWPNYTEDGLKELMTSLQKSTKYYIIGREICPKTSTPHLQMYLEFLTRKRLSELKKLNSAIHWEKTLKPRLANVRYCKKEGKYIEFEPELRSTTTSKSFASRLTEIATSEPSKFSQHLPALHHIASTELWTRWYEQFLLGRYLKPAIIYITGRSGSGKTWMCYSIAGELYHPEDISVIECSNSFLNAQNIRAKCWIFPEFRASTLEATVFLQMTDIYPFVANIKGTYALVRPECVIIASIKPLSELYKEEINLQFRRRITNYINMELMEGTMQRMRETEQHLRDLNLNQVPFSDTSLRYPQLVQVRCSQEPAQIIELMTQNESISTRENPIRDTLEDPSATSPESNVLNSQIENEMLERIENFR